MGIRWKMPDRFSIRGEGSFIHNDADAKEALEEMIFSNAEQKCIQALRVPERG
jgi:hypothetical protein